MTETIASRIETSPSKEAFSTAEQMTGLQTRMALSGEALNPQKLDLPEVKVESLTNLAQTINLVALGSTIERKNYWDKRWQQAVEQDESLANLSASQRAEKQKEIWRQEMVAVFADQKNQAVVSRLNAKKIGGIDLANFSQETANQIYNRYFTRQADEQEVKISIDTEEGKKEITISSALNRFINDVVEAYQGDWNQLDQDLEVISWYAGIFGGNSSVVKGVKVNELIKELVATKAKLANNEKKQQLVNQANEKIQINDQETTRLNWLNPKEKAGLDWLYYFQKMMTQSEASLPTSSSGTETDEPESAPDNEENGEKGAGSAGENNDDGQKPDLPETNLVDVGSIIDQLIEGKPVETKLKPANFAEILKQVVGSIPFKRGLFRKEQTPTQVGEAQINFDENSDQWQFKLPVSFKSGFKGKKQTTEELKIIFGEDLKYVLPKKAEKESSLAKQFRQRSLAEWIKEYCQQQLDLAQAGVSIGDLTLKSTDEEDEEPSFSLKIKLA